MTAQNDLSCENVCRVLEELHGNIAAAARRLKCARNTLYSYCLNHPTAQQTLENAREAMLDNVESVLYDATLRGESWAVLFFLRTRGKKRGYIERSEITGPDGEPLNMTVEVRGVDYRTIAAALAPGPISDSDPSGED